MMYIYAYMHAINTDKPFNHCLVLTSAYFAGGAAGSALGREDE